jgi:hypothetical protein
MKVEAPALRFLPEAPKNGYELWTVAIDGRGDFDRGTLACREGAFTEIFLPWPSVDGMGRVLPNLAAIEVYAFTTMPPSEIWKIAREAYEKRQVGIRYATPVKLPNNAEVSIGWGVLLTLIDSEKCALGPPYC